MRGGATAPLKRGDRVVDLAPQVGAQVVVVRPADGRIPDVERHAGRASGALAAAHLREQSPEAVIVAQQVKLKRAEHGCHQVTLTPCAAEVANQLAHAGDALQTDTMRRPTKVLQQSRREPLALSGARRSGRRPTARSPAAGRRLRRSGATSSPSAAQRRRRAVLQVRLRRTTADPHLKEGACAAVQVKLTWPPNMSSGLRRSARSGCDYEAYLPDSLAGRRISLSGETAADVADAERAVERSTGRPAASPTPKRLPGCCCGQRPSLRPGSRA